MIKTSGNFETKRKRIEQMPHYFIGAVKGQLKRDAVNCIKNFQRGIQFNSLHLEKLQDGTVVRKRGLGYENPDSPLYGKGLSDPRSYTNMLNIRELKNGWKVYPSSRKHHSGKVTLKTLFYVHEYGITISTAKGPIRIPPRPALYRAYEMTMNGQHFDKRGRYNRLRSAVKQFIDEGRLELFKQEAKLRELGKAYERND